MNGKLKIVQCLRCGWEWPTRSKRPTVCPKCKTPYWDKEKKEVKPRL